jgi:LuxR family maltose regulon positive regulatory protein
MPALDLFWLGSPRVELDGRPLRLETRKVTALLALLSLERKAQSRERLAALLWPEYDSVRAPANLRRTLASLQSSLGAGWLRADRETVALEAPGRVRIDLEDLESRVREVRAHHADPRERICPSCEEKLAGAARLHAGDFLEGFNLKDCPEFDQWQTLKRDELLQAMSWAMERLAEASAEAGRWEEAIERARRWLSLDELHEPAHRTLMFLYARSGRRSAALRQYEECARQLLEELGEEPEERTRALYERIRRRKLPAPSEGGTGTRTAEGAAGLRTAAGSPGGPAPAPQPAARPPLHGVPETRLHPPPIRPSRVRRERLFVLLDRGTRCPLTLISAPAGFGKTTLLAEWVQRCDMPVAWLQLEEADGDPAHFLASLAAALAHLDPTLGAEALQMLRSIQVPSLAAVVDSLLGDLGLSPGARVLVLDDFHLIGRPETQKLLGEVVQRLPADFHLFVATRVDPTLPLARLRVRAQLAEVRADDLRFLPEEAATFLRSVMGLELSEEDVGVLDRRTEGWAAGLQMAALSLQSREDRTEFIRSFGGSHRYVMDYLVGEVLEGQPPAVQEFLLCTSVLERFCAGLCDAVAERSESQALLEGLDRANLFLVPLDDERLWYRYHHLFAELLRHRLRQNRSAERVAELHFRAGRWLEDSADWEAAMRHYLEGRHIDEALRLLEERHKSILGHGGLGMLLGWAAQLPAAAVRRNAAACVTVGTIHAWAGRRGEAESLFAQADALLSAEGSGAEGSGAEGAPPESGGAVDRVPPDPGAGGALSEGPAPERAPSERAEALAGRAAVMRAFVADVAGETDRAVELARRADRALRPDEGMLRSLIPYILGKAHRFQGDLRQAEAFSNEHIRIARAANNTWSYSGAVHEMIWVHRLQGRLREADRVLAEFEALPREAGTSGPVAKLIAHRGELERERGRLEAAARSIGIALEHVERWRLPSDMYFCYLSRCRLKLSAGRPAAATEDVERADELRRTSSVYASMFPLLEAERVRVLLAGERLTEALAWLDGYRFPADGSPVNREVVLIARARVLLAAGQVEEARTLLDRLAAEAAAGARNGRLLEIRVLQARAAISDQAAAADGPGPEAARELLRQALALAEPEGYARVFLDEGEPVVRLLRECADPGQNLPPPLAAYARRLLESLPA